MGGTQLARVVAAHGRHCLVEGEDGQRTLCHPRGKKSAVVVGDIVAWQRSGDEGSIERIETRRNLFYRQDDMRTKAFAANLDQVLILLAAEPVFSESQLTRALLAAEAEGISAFIVLNKQDLGEAFEQAWARLAAYRRMGTPVLPLGLQQGQGLDALRERLAGRHTLVLGPSGVGKSTLVNRLVPEAGAQTGEISRALNTGRHTTTSTTWYWLDAARESALIDSPGFQEFGLHHLEAEHLAQLMPDLRATLGDCRFYNCTHRHEPGCGVRSHVGADPASDPLAIDEVRYRLYNELFDELANKRTY
ncbi:MAG: ribosome small subunit-dependent GTPase A [Hydrogenophaga sp.]|uniref:ribosome small subunit-dependent GTPase A n=1 Tax=Hydrogenophaga sp. TaxID=1904254 RepID=UPI00169BFAA4|nr:ribosome small subunit-dependent GTPase A [Hydrogenophaga sp.]NIM41812.1 ribosome small subunit-dependent GTPase A [Hydrogenophaga sp.]NIN27117.1 ribosome small subunit-dependent GTPase A [Hydrogenophaga sp.]NIN31818.1 ribosome small subunit-dependent GTPase A [Hydrogenophaga sp.]NIN56062.1 ribosome small subunit-dependent GTPase A [Hydrogenophaga sp.]NIO52189.1 ribosome small subunit-dependent GTPase A [Hydrogenophaga sp.]